MKRPDYRHRTTRSLLFSSLHCRPLLAPSRSLSQLPWMMGTGGTDSSATPNTALEEARIGRSARAGARLGRAARLFRLLRLARVAKLYKFIGSKIVNRKEDEDAAAAAAKASQKGRSKTAPGGSSVAGATTDTAEAAGGKGGAGSLGKKAKQQRVNFGGGSGAAIKDSTTTQGAVKDEAGVDEDDDEQKKPMSRVGAKVADEITRVVIAGVLMALIVIPLLERTVDPLADDTTIEYVHTYYMCAEAIPAGTAAAAAWTLGMDRLAVFMTGGAMPGLLKLSMNGTLLANDTTNVWGTLRDSERYQLQFKQDNAYLTPKAGEAMATYCNATWVKDTGLVYTTTAWMSLRTLKQDEALFGIILTLVVIVLLTLGAMIISSDAYQLVLRPLEMMVDVVEDISEHPLSMKPFNKIRGSKNYQKMFRPGMETTLLLNSITRISRLLRVGFGEGGSRIITSNLNEQAEIDTRATGTYGRVIFAQFEITDWMVLNDVLKEEYVPFMSRVANVIHGITSKYDAEFRENVGGGFLVIWRSTAKEKNIKAAKAIMSVIKILAQLRRDETLTNFQQETARKVQQRIPGFSAVNINVALHSDWAIEGAVGSDRKLDAAYVSPSLHVRKCLNAMANEYNVPVLATFSFWDLLPKDIGGLFRLVDKVHFPDTEVFKPFMANTLDLGGESKNGGAGAAGGGRDRAVSIEPVSPMSPSPFGSNLVSSASSSGNDSKPSKLALYTIDANLDGNFRRDITPPESAGQHFKRVTKSAAQWLNEKEQMEEEFSATRTYFSKDEDFIELRKGVTPAFLEASGDAVQVRRRGAQGGGWEGEASGGGGLRGVLVEQ